MIRSELREHVFKMVFQIEFNEPADMPEHFELYIDSLERATDQDRTYIETKYKAVLEKIVDKDTDSLRFYNLGDKYKNKVEHIGAKPSFDVAEPLIF